jgi:nitroimidazol reductase NimA-like FMN-containing flavoprotein (pyridoxamine 5'-phosphate oxidase superfamily)
VSEAVRLIGDGQAAAKADWRANLQNDQDHLQQHEAADWRRRSVILPSVAGPSRRANQFVELEREECLRLLAETTLGRLAISPPGWPPPPIIRPVNYVFDPASQSVVFRSTEGSKLRALLLSSDAAFEIDGADLAAELGWSVIVQGPAEEITRPADLTHVEALGLRPWAPAQMPHWLRIRTTVVSGRQLLP